MRLASLIQKSLHGATSMPAYEIFKMATINGAKALKLDKEIGSIEVGKKADLVFLDLNKVWNPVLNNENIFSSIVYSAGPENVDSVMINGKWIYRKREFVNIDVDKIVAEAKLELKKLLDRVEYQ